MGKKIVDGWNDYRARVIPPNAGSTQISESRLAFYAGVMHLFTHLYEISTTPDNPTQEELDLDRLDALHVEIQEFAKTAGVRPRPVTVEDPHEAVAVSEATGWSVVDWGDSLSPSAPRQCVGLIIHSESFKRSMEILVKAGEVPEKMGKAELMIRIKSPGAIDDLAAALLHQRDAIWPDRVHVCLGCGGTKCIDGRCHYGKRGGA